MPADELTWRTDGRLHRDRDLRRRLLGDRRPGCRNDSGRHRRRHRGSGRRHGHGDDPHRPTGRARPGADRLTPHSASPESSSGWTAASARGQGCGWLMGMQTRAGQVTVHYVEHGTGRPVLVLHGAGVDHREAEACFEPALEGVAGLRRIYPDLPGMGRTIAPEGLRSADDVVDTLLAFADEVTGGAAHLLIGHSAGAYYAQGMTTQRAAQVAGLALVCPLTPGARDVPEHRVVAGTGAIGD